MSRPGPEPRINSRLLNKYQGQTVRLTAKVVNVNGDTATVEASDGGQIGVHLSREMHLSDTFVEIIGTVKDDLTIKAFLGFNMGNSLDMKAVNAVVELAQSHKGEGVLAA
ncbi:replication factor A protein 3 [Papiliotrema laurentii]|uniref:Replication factor A protein 3 n=1 Tax=Papiliotrema laurentii TaxID=5418 RepID=A0AAD9FRV5_PAPLA|nr:replication factor A protein 3 [Papiliotrema laurentii]